MVHFKKVESLSNVERILYIGMAFPAASSSMKTLLWGYRFRTSGSLIGPWLAQGLREAGWSRLAEGYEVNTNVSTNGFKAFLVETGLVGILLLAMNFLCTGYRILAQKNKNYWYGSLILSLTMSLLWFFITNLMDIVLFYLMIMPSGLLIQLSKNKREE